MTERSHRVLEMHLSFQSLITQSLVGIMFYVPNGKELATTARRISTCLSGYLKSRGSRLRRQRLSAFASIASSACSRNVPTGTSASHDGLSPAVKLREKLLEIGV